MKPVGAATGPVRAGTLAVTGDAAADALLNNDPLALLLGMLLDQQIPMEWAFIGPHRLAERLGSPRLKALWGPADNFNSGESGVATAGYRNIRPYLHGLHLKDLRVIDGQRLHFQYCPLGAGDVDYVTILRQLRVHHAETILAMATHFRPASGSPVEAMRTNFAQLADLISQAE